MGAFLVNFHAKSDDAESLRSLLQEMAERAWLAPPRDGWMSFYEERADVQDAGRIMELAEAEMLIDRGADVNGGDLSGATPLQFAVRTESAELVRLLLKRGADVNFANSQGWTALHDAAGSQRLEFVQILLEAGADPTLQNDQGQTPRQYAEMTLANFEQAISQVSGHEPAVQFVRQAITRMEEIIRMLSAAEE